MAAKIGYSKVEPISRDLLKGFKDLRLEVRSLRSKIADLEEIYAPVAVWSDMPKAQGGVSDKVAEIVERKEELRERYVELLHELLEKEKQVLDWCEGLNAFDRVMIQKLYFEGKNWIVTAEEMETTPNTICGHLRVLCLD